MKETAPLRIDPARQQACHHISPLSEELLRVLGNSDGMEADDGVVDGVLWRGGGLEGGPVGEGAEVVA
jgi:hypothetical protein